MSSQMSSKVQDAAKAFIKSKQSAISSSKASFTSKDCKPIMLVKKSDAKKEPKKQKEVKVISFSIANK
jgi:hypothetical protein